MGRLYPGPSLESGYLGWVLPSTACSSAARRISAKARSNLLSRFARTVDFRAAERIGRACLLLPGTPEETSQATALIDRAIADAKTGPQAWVYPYFMFAKGLAEYRTDRFDPNPGDHAGRGIRRAEAGPPTGRVDGLHRLGRREEAKKTLETAIGRFDWKDARVNDREAWMYHALRREAEQLIGSIDVKKEK